MLSDEAAYIRRTLTFARLDVLRKRCDPLADDVLASIFADPEARREPDLLEACRRLALRGDPAATRFETETSRLPDWVAFDRFSRGRELFLRHGVVTFLAGFTVLVDSYAGAKDNKVLVASGRLRDDGAFRRLVETASFTLSVVEEDALCADGRGRRAALSVRLLHAKVRRFCRAHGYDTSRWDEPINQEAMCGTLMLFSSGIILALERLGVYVTDEEKESYHALWRAVGWLMGIDEELLPETWAGECALYEIMKEHQYWPDADTRLLFEQAVRSTARGARALPTWTKLVGGGLMQSEAFLRAFTARCVDPRLSSYLELHPDTSHRLAFDAVASVLGTLSRWEATRPRARSLIRSTQAALLRSVVRSVVGAEPVKFVNPGFVRTERSTDCELQPRRGELKS